MPTSWQALICGAVVAAIGDGHERALADGLACSLGHRSQLRAITTVVGDLAGNDQMVLRVNGSLYVVADDARSPTAGRHGSRVRIGQ